MKFYSVKIQEMCHDFIVEKKDFPTDIILEPKIDNSSWRFFEGLFQVLAHQEEIEDDIHVFSKRIKRKIEKRLNPENFIEKLKENLIKRNHLVDYDLFKSKINSLLEQGKHREAGKLAEQYISQYTGYKDVLKYENESEHEPLFFLKKDNKDYFPQYFKDESIRISFSPDFFDKNEIFEFKFTEKQENLIDKVKEGYCQASFYAFIDYFQYCGKIERKFKKYKIIVEVYVFENNTVYTYEFEPNIPNVELIERISEFYKNKTGIDLSRLICGGNPIFSSI
jgi:hypothetical protein